ncbi:hypothetical protein C1645_816741 [Glomus cerebriforme]|uniref:Uncharacterized protein n=1 Tax=Glomus cerebriforme TaxID=658196 RepID=A0A397TDF5_9GLOM|nr:hypothetical protein C1645_816741 [Glomus cerebriforme]
MGNKHSFRNSNKQQKKQKLNSGSFAAFKSNNSSSSATPTSNDQSEHNITREFGPFTFTSHSTILPVLLTVQTTSGPVHVKASMFIKFQL